MDVDLRERLESQRKTVAALRTSLAPRREAEAKELAELEQRLSSTRARLDAAPAELHAAGAAIVRARAEAQALSTGLSALRRRWVNAVEPVLASLLLFVGIVTVGTSWAHKPQVAGLAVAGFLVGTVASAAWRRWGRG